MMYISGNTTAFIHNQTHVFTGLVKPLRALGASCCSPKKRIGSNCNIVLLEHIFDQVTLIFIVLLFVGLI